MLLLMQFVFMLEEPHGRKFVLYEVKSFIKISFDVKEFVKLAIDRTMQTTCCALGRIESPLQEKLRSSGRSVDLAQRVSHTFSFLQVDLAVDVPWQELGHKGTRGNVGEDRLRPFQKMNT